MSSTATHRSVPSSRTGPDTGSGLDADLARTIRRTAWLRQLFYLVVLATALTGQVSGAVEALAIPPLWAVPAVSALELGGIVVLANADTRRRLGERATASRLLSAAIATAAVAFNWLAHTDKLLAGFFAGMSALGYLVWLMHTENQRRDRLRATGNLPPTTPAYELVAHWLRHPGLTLRAQHLAKITPQLGLYQSIAAAQAEHRREQRSTHIAKILHRKIRAAVDPTTADLAITIYDLDEIGRRLGQYADYDTLTALIAADLTPLRLINDSPALTNQPPPNPLRPAPAAGIIDHLLDPTTITVEQPNPAGNRPSTPKHRAWTELPDLPGAADRAPYAPTSPADAAMYEAWRHGITNGHEPTGADLARTAGRPDDTTGIGRRAVRRYRNAHHDRAHHPET